MLTPKEFFLRLWFGYCLSHTKSDALYLEHNIRMHFAIIQLARDKQPSHMLRQTCLLGCFPK